MDLGIFKPYSREARTVALYWYAAANHGGQWSRLYRVLSRCSAVYRPGRLMRALRPSDDAEAYHLMRALVRADAR